MKIVDSASFFLDHYKADTKFLKEYYNKYNNIFSEYFKYHCKDSEERQLQSLHKYSLSTLKKVHDNIIPVIKETVNTYNTLYRIAFPIDVNLIIGQYGSNAYTHRQIIPNITFALERLSPNKNYLKVIVAHEFGHAVHNILTDQVGYDWSEMQWDNPLIWLYQEGIATHFSRKISPNLPPHTYFSYNDEGADWLAFCKENKSKIKQQFTLDLTNEKINDVFYEWFSIRGGEKFGHNRLGYFIGDLFVQEQIQSFGEMKTITFWKETQFIDYVRKWLQDN